MREVKWIGLNGFPTSLYHRQLDYECQASHTEEQPVIEKVAERIHFTLELARVHLVENLHEYETLEYDGEM